MDSWQRLEAVIKWAGMSTNKFALHIGLKRSENLYQIKKGNNSISSKLATRIVDQYPQIDFSWLMTGFGEMLAGSEHSNSISKDIALFKGDPKEEGFFRCGPHETIISSAMVGCDIAIQPSQSVVMSLIPQGATLFLRKIDLGFIDYGQIYLVVVDGESLVVRVRRESGGKVRLEISDDESIEARVIALDRVNIMFLVQGYMVLL